MMLLLQLRYLSPVRGSSLCSVSRSKTESGGISKKYTLITSTVETHNKVNTLARTLITCWDGGLP